MHGVKVSHMQYSWFDTSEAVELSKCLTRWLFICGCFALKNLFVSSDSLSRSKENVNWSKCILVKKKTTNDLQLTGVN